ncbi:MAG TPA: isoprenylcysteine carboxylmethyltransferase family protein [Candidatus Binataceae bacterium]|nr:isoprenylcysteine carboxylmethyltransferase family protein [Candidatus Binataceae bacterium]
MSLKVYLVLLALLAVERLSELLRAASNRRWALARGAVESGHGVHRLMVTFHCLFFVSCAAETVLFRPPFPGWLGWLALVVALLAQALRAWVIATLGPRWNTRVLVVPGLAPVRAGPYCWIRHPNYLAVALEIVAVPLIHGCWRTALSFSLMHIPLLAARIRVEERAMGPGYQDLMDRQPRFVPRSSRPRSAP